MNSQRLTKIFLRLFIAAVVGGALVGIAAIGVPSDHWEYRIKILLTTAIIAGASICGLACGGCLTRGHRLLPTAGLALTGVSAALLLVGLWAQIDAEWFWKTTVSLAFFAVACSHLSMLFLANLAGSYRWSYLVAYQLILGMAALLTGGVVFELFERNQGYWRLTGVVAILVAAITLLIPVFHRFSREEVAAAAAEADPLFALESEIAVVKKRLIELQNKRQILLGRQPIEAGDESIRV